jgi:hypothetical protein
VAISAFFTVLVLVWDPHVRDLAAQTFRSELFERNGFAIWNGSWFGGHYTLTYSVLFPPLGALVGPRLVGAVSVVLSAYLFDRLVRDHWGERAGWATLWFGLGAVTLLLSGRVTFALGVAIALLALRFLQTGRRPEALVAAAGTALASPVAAVFLGGTLLAAALARANGSPRTLLGVGGAAIGVVVAINLAFPGGGEFPFAFSSFVGVPLWCAGALLVTRGIPEERTFRTIVVAYLLGSVLVWLTPNPIGGNAVRLGALFGGPVLAAILLSRRTRAPELVVALVLAGSLYWQLMPGIRDVAETRGDPSGVASYYEPLRRWLHAHGGHRARIEVPPSANQWEAAYLAPSFALARGWLRQMDTTQNEIFYDEGLTHPAYAGWLRENGVRYVALSSAPVDYSAERERELLLAEPSYLRLRWRSADWTVYEVRRREPLLFAAGEERARLLRLKPESFTVAAAQPGRMVVRVRYTPFWSVDPDLGCVSRAGDWTGLEVRRPGPVRVSIAFSPGGVMEDFLGRSRDC